MQSTECYKVRTVSRQILVDVCDLCTTYELGDPPLLPNDYNPKQPPWVGYHQFLVIARHSLCLSIASR